MALIEFKNLPDTNTPFTAENFNHNFNELNGKVLYDNSSGSNGVITLSETSANFKYLEVFFSDTSDRNGGYIKLYEPNGKSFHFSLIATSADKITIIRRTEYVISGNTMTPDTTNAGYVYISSASLSTEIGLNRIKILRVVGYKN